VCLAASTEQTQSSVVLSLIRASGAQGDYLGYTAKWYWARLDTRLVRSNGNPCGSSRTRKMENMNLRRIAGAIYKFEHSGRH